MPVASAEKDDLRKLRLSRDRVKANGKEPRLAGKVANTKTEYAPAYYMPQVHSEQPLHKRSVTLIFVRWKCHLIQQQSKHAYQI